MAEKVLLIVEDEPILGLEIQETLELLGYKVPEVVPSADQVLSAFARTMPDLVIMDIQLRSYSNGIDAVKRLRLIKNVPVVFLTANHISEVELQARSLANTVYISKPYDEEELVQAIEHLLDSF